MEYLIDNNDKYFPEYSWFKRAVSYPYEAPKTSFTLKDGKFYKGLHISLKNRIPILSIGSNRSPYQLKNKFGLEKNLCVTPVKLYNSEVVYAASISAYGSIPATQWPCENSESDLNLLWLSEDQLSIMHLTEGLGIAYNYVELDRTSVFVMEVDYSGPIFGYVSIRGGYLFREGTLFKLKKIKSKNNKFPSIYEHEALDKLCVEENGSKIHLKNWLKLIISSKNKRLLLIEKMSKRSILPKEVPWKVLKIKVKGNNIY